MRLFRLPAVLACALTLTTFAPSAQAAGPEFQTPGTQITISPSDLPAPFATDSVANSAQRIARPSSVVPDVPAGFRASVFADGLTHARWLAVAPNGDVFLAESSAGKVTVLRDADGDGVAEASATWVEGLRYPHGLAFRDGFVYVADTRAVWRYPYAVGQMTASDPAQQVTPSGALGDGSGHATRSILISDDGATLYVAVGSRSNIGVEAAPRATIQAFDLVDGGAKAENGRTFASGLRNPVGLAVEPVTGALWTVVNERDGLGDELVPDYLTAVREGAFYGWPYSYIGSHPQPELAGRAPDLVASAVVPDLLFRTHSAPLGLVFYGGTQFPEAYRGDAFVALHGSWNAMQPRGYAVARVRFKDGRPVGGYELFATGFWAGGAGRARVWGRPVGLAVAADGALLVADDVGQVVWRIVAE